MSNYEKNYPYDYNPSARPTQEQDYSVYAQTSSAYGVTTQQTPTTQASEPHGTPHANQMPFLSATYTPRDPGYPPSQAAYNPAKSPPPLEITSNSPYHGFVNDTLRIHFKTTFEYNPSKYIFLVSFGGKFKIKATLYKEFYQDPFHHFLLEITVPNLEGEHQAMPLILDIQDENALLEQKSLGDFYYSPGGYQSYPTEQRKRKFSEETSDFSVPNAKRSASQPLRPAKFEGSSKSSAVPYSSASSLPPNILYALPTDRPTSQGARYSQLSAHQRPMYGYSPTLGSQSIKAESPVLNTYGIAYDALKQSSSPQISQVSAIPMRRTVTASSTPTWVRESHAQPSSRPPAFGSVPTFNPYSQFPTGKAKLQLVGDLATMCDGWTPYEREEGRRLVEFTRSLQGSKITASFRGVTAEQRTPSNPCVSCIYWPRRRTHYVTSVDTIALLEGLVAARFTVEEKNRIRRNLEGFKPYTVSKNKDECDDAFRLIMGFQAPKPRNIEKDIKIFPWSVLAHALKKIIGKYTASFASTSGHIGISISAAESGATFTEASDGKTVTASPSSNTAGSAAIPFAGSMTSTSTMSPSMGTISAGLNIPGGPHDLRTSTSMPHLYGETGSWVSAGGVGSGYNAPAYTAGLAASAPTRTWGLEAAYLQNTAGGPASSGAAGQSPSGYYRTSDDELLQHSTSSGGARHPGGARFLEHTSRPQ